MPRNSSFVPSVLFLRGSQLHQVRDGGDALLLQKGGLAHQRACCQKENPALPPPLQPGQEMPAEHCCTAPRPRSAAVHRLAIGILTGGLTAAAAGITTSLVCGGVCSLVGRSHDQN